MKEKAKYVAGAVVSLFLAFVFLISALADGKGGLMIFVVIFGAAFGYCLNVLNKFDKAGSSAPARQQSQQRTAPAAHKAQLIGGIDYITSKGITPDMVYGLNTKYSSKDGFGSVYFPKNFGSLSFAKKFDAVKVCIITTERPNFRNIKLGENVLLVPEPTNAYDRNAIMILSRTQKLGYIYRNGIQDILNEKFRGGCVVVGSVVSKEAKSDYIKIDIVVYK